MCQFKLLVKLDYGQIKCSLPTLLNAMQRIIAEFHSADLSNNSHNNYSENAALLSKSKVL